MAKQNKTTEEVKAGKTRGDPVVSLTSSRTSKSSKAK